MNRLAQRHRRDDRRRHPPRHLGRSRHQPGRRAARPDLGGRRCGRLPAVSWTSPQAQVPGRRCWAVEGAGSYGAGLAAFLQGGTASGWSSRPAQAAGAPQRRQERRPGRRPGGAGGAGQRPPRDSTSSWRPRGAAGAAGHPPQRLPGQGERDQPAQGADRGRAGGVASGASRAGDQAAVAAAPAAGSANPVAGASHDRPGAALDRPAHPAAGRRGRRAAGRAGAAGGRGRAVAAELPGVGPISAAQVLVSWSHAGRLRSEAAFAALAGASPIPASSGQVTRHRLNRSGDRQLNRALIPSWSPDYAMTPPPAPMPPAARAQGKRRPRHPPMLEARGRPAAVQAAGRPQLGAGRDRLRIVGSRQGIAC